MITVYEQIGGAESLEKVVERFYEKALADEIVSSSDEQPANRLAPMSGKFAGLLFSLVAAASSVCAGSAGADPDEEQAIRWSEESSLLDGSYAVEPRQVWSADIGGEGLSLRSSGFGRDGDIGYFQLFPDDGTSRAGMLVAVDLGSGATVFRREVPAGAWCLADQEDHAVNCGGFGFQESAQWLVIDSRSGEALIDQSLPGGVLASGAEHGVAYVLTRAAAGDARGDVELFWRPVRGAGPSGKTVLRLKKKPPPRRTPQQRGQQIMQGVAVEIGAPWDGVIHALVSSGEFEPTQIDFTPATGEARVKNFDTSSPTISDQLDPIAAVQIGEEQLSVRIHGDTVYDRGTGEALWSNPALLNTARAGAGGRAVRISAVRAVVHGYLVVERSEPPAFQVFDLRTGDLRWEAPGSSLGFIYLTDGRYAVDVDREMSGSIVATDLATGEQAWRIATPGDAWAVTMLDGDVLAVGGTTVTRYTAA
ncbi:PQQ-binding-like beta-propeller repeat protein [Segniliparus rugosus]|uniref:PQQ-like domain-containing protein n=1 Tax=Segniliparus rugosus (strain ATCC BAA-974 / DSM 45345 / CCUG 50838 / CIP 108380 / JCM 13579 / CDC 945) TaxID=679197 RepID=E5XNE9_SEGRC|nr:PQQ-binding-like beta-propeller repeat protein [Segniliparus rugosus]EFV14158.2 hypothetical protein HMPREF9336_01075 [Segniliparus rugosus ATCC BAA-974]